MSVIEVSFNQRHIRTKHRDIGRPDKGLAGTREFGLKIGTFPQKPGRVATLRDHGCMVASDVECDALDDTIGLTYVDVDETE
jgi:hypothetical protein